MMTGKIRPSLFNFLRGSWTLTRTIKSNDSYKLIANASGTATFTQSPSSSTTLHYFESGTTLISPSTTSIPFTREYIYECINQNEAIVSFIDKTLFHRLKFNDGVAEPEMHYCGGDVYGGRVVLDGDGMKHEWRVEGAGKDYTICTEFRRSL
jgi:hypothetical protein